MYTVDDSQVMITSVIPEFIGSNLNPSSWSISLLDRDSDNLYDAALFTADLTNTADNVEDEKDKAIIIVTTEVILNNTNAVSQNLRAPVADLAYGIVTPSVTATPTLTLVIPDLTLGIDTDVSQVEATTLVKTTIRIAAVNGNTKSAGYDIDLSSIIPPELHVVANTLAITGTGYNPTIYDGSTADADEVSIGFVHLNKGGSITITFDSTVDENVLLGITITIPANLRYCSAPLTYGRACFTDSAEADIQVRPPTLSFVVHNTSLTETANNDLAIGERIVYRASLTYPKGDAHESTLKINLPRSGAHQLVLSNSVVFVGGNFNATSFAAGLISDADNDDTVDTVSISLPALSINPSGPTSGDVITFEIVALLTNSDGNINGGQGNAQAVYTYNRATTSEIITTVVLPDLSIEKVHVAPSYVDAYTTVDYTITVSHTSSSRAPAYDTVILDLLPPTLSLVGTVTSSVAGVDIVTSQVSAGTLIKMTTALFVSGSIQITYTAEVQPSAVASAYITNNVNVTYNSSYVFSYNTNNIRNFDNEATDKVEVAAPAILFRISSLVTSLAETDGTNVAIGELITITLDLTVPRGRTQNAKLDITLPTTNGKLRAINGVLSHLPDSVTISQVPPFDATVTKNGDTTADKIVFELGLITNDPDGGANSNITFTVSMLVSNVTSTIRNDQITPAAVFSYNNGTSDLSKQSTFTVTVVEPLLELVNEVAVSSYTASGTVVQFTLTVRNVSPSNGPSYYVYVYNPLSAHYSLNTGTVDASSGEVVVGNGAGHTYVLVAVETMLRTETITITFSATLTDVVLASEPISNTAYLNYSSALVQEHNTNDIRQRSTSASSAVTIAKPVVGFVLNRTTVDDTIGNDVTIGEEASLVATLNLPQGITENAVLRVTVAKDPTKMHILYARVAYVASFMGAAYSVGDLIQLQDSNSDDYDDTAEFDFGDVVNPSGGTAHTTRTVAAIVEIFALVVDTENNANGEELTNTAAFYYGNNRREDAADIDLEIVLPFLKITKTFELPSNYIEAGSSIRYIVEIEHTGTSTSTAFDIVVIDPLSSLMDLQPATVSTSQGTTETGEINGVDYIKVNPGKLAKAGKITIRYNVTYTNLLPSSYSVYNKVNATYYSAPQDSYNSGNIRSDTINDDAIVESAVPVLTFSLHNTSISQTPSNNVTVGEIAVFRSAITIPHGITEESTLTIRMASGLHINYGQIVIMSSLVDSSNSLEQYFSATPTDTNNDNYYDTLVFDFGELSFPFDGVFRSNNGRIVIEISALVVNRDSNINLAQLCNTATFSYSDSTDLTSNTCVRVVLPDMSLVKEASTPIYTEAGTIVMYTLTFSHSSSSTSPAFNLTAEDLLSSPYLSLVSNSVKISVGNVVTGNTAGDKTIYVEPPTILLSEKIVVTYNATLTLPTITGSVVPNEATLWYASAIATAENNNGKDVKFFSTSGSAEVQVSKPEVDFVVESGSLDSDIPLPSVTIGETVVLVATITLPAGFTNAARLAITLPNGQLEALFGTVEYVSANINSSVAANTRLEATQHNGFSDTVSVSFGTVNNIPDAYQRSDNDKLIISIVALVVNSSLNTNGFNLVAQAAFSYHNGAQTQEEEDEVTLTVRLPSMTIEKEAKAPSYLQAGDVIQYTVTLGHSGSSSSPAYSIIVSDLLASSSLELVAGSVVSSKGGIVTGDEIIIVQPDTMPTTSSDLVITYNATLAIVAESATHVYNYVGAQYSSAPPDNLYNGDDIRIAIVNASASVLVASPSLSFSLKNTSLAETEGHNVSISESVTFRAVVTLPHGTTSNAILTVSLPVTPGKLQLVSGTVISIPSNAVPTSLGVNSAGVPSDSNSDEINDAITFNFGTIVCTPNGDTDGNDIMVEVTALTIDIPENVGGTVLASSAKLTFGASGQIQSPSVDVIIVEPNLEAVQTCSPSIGESGDVISCIVTVHPLSVVVCNSLYQFCNYANLFLQPAYLVTFSNNFVEGTYSLVAGSVTTSSGSVSSGNNVGDTSFSVATSVFVSSTNFTITFQATLTDVVESNTNVTTTTLLTYASGPSSGARVSSRNATSTTLIYPPVVTIEVTATSLEDTPEANVTIGEVVTFVTSIDVAKGLTSTPTLLISTGNALQILNAQVLSLGSSEGCTEVPTGDIQDTNGDGTSDSVTFDFSPRLCRPASSLLGNVEVQVRAVVLDITTSVSNALLSVQATLEYAAGTTVASTSVIVVEPHLDLSKISSTTIVGGDQGNNVTYTLTLSHVGSTSNAYDLKLVDEVPTSLQIVESSIAASIGQVSVDNNTITVLIEELPLGATFTLSYATSLLPSVLAGGVIVNHATVQYASAPEASLPFAGAARIGEDSASVEILIGIPILTDFVVYNTSLSSGDPDLSSYPNTYYFAVGEVVTFRLTSSVPGGLTEYILLSQVIPLTTGEYNVTSVSGLIGPTVSSQYLIPSIAGDIASYNFSEVSNDLEGSNKDGYVILELQVVVADVEANHYPSIVSTIGHLESPLGNSNRKINLSIVEAFLDISSTATTPSPSFIEAGNIVTYTTVVSHTSSSTTTAYTLEIVDTLSQYVRLVAGSVTTSTGVISSGNTDGDEHIAVSVDSLLLSESVTITYQAEIVTSSIASSSFSNDASLTFLSAPRSSLNAGFVRSTSLIASPAVLTIASPSVIFEVASTSVTSPAAPAVVIGATAVLAVHITLPLGTTPNTTVSVSLASGVTGVLALTDASALALTNADLISSIALVDTDGDSTNDTATFTLGDLVNIDGAELGASPFITLSLTTFIPDVEANVVGNPLVSTVVLTYNNETTGLVLPPASVELDLAGPQLAWTVTWNTTTGQAGDAVAGHLIVSHADSSTAPAYGLDIASLFPFLDVIPDSLRTSRTVGALTYVELLALDESTTIDFTGVLTTDVIVSSIIEFSINNSYSSAATRGRISKSQPLVTPFTIAPAPFANISLYNTSNPEVQGNVVLVGENATLYVTLDIPYGTILDPSLTLNVLPSANTTALQFLASSVVVLENSTDALNISNELVNVSSAYSFESLVNYPVVNGSKTVVFAFDVVVLPDPSVVDGDVLTVESLFSFSNGTHLLSQGAQNISLVVAVAQFGFEQSCSPTSIDFEGTAQCTIVLYPLVTIPAYQLTIQNSISSLYSLLTNTIISSHGVVTLTNNSQSFQVEVPLYDPTLGANITITYSTTLTAEAVRDSEVEIPAYLTYLSSPTVFAIQSALDATARVQVDSSGGGLSGGAIAGIVIGATVGAAAVAAAAFALLKSKAAAPANPFASTDTNMATTVEDNPLFEGNQFSSQNNPLYNNV